MHHLRHLLILLVGLAVPALFGHPDLSRQAGPQAMSEQAAARTLDDLPAAAQGAISAAIGRDQAAYHAVIADDAELTFANSGHKLGASLGTSGVRVRQGDDTWDFGLIAYGYGDRMRPVTNVAPTGDANRVEYARDGLTEWYVNGPGGWSRGSR